MPSKNRRKGERRTFKERPNGFGGVQWMGYDLYQNRHSQGKNDRRKKR